MDEKKKQEMLSRMIVSYLRKHPGAGDTLEGITKWWLELERIELSVDEVADVLKQLVQQGKLVECKRSEGVVIYKVNKQYNVR